MNEAITSSCLARATPAAVTSAQDGCPVNGVFSEEPDGSNTFHEATHLPADDVHHLQRTLQRRVLRLFQRPTTSPRTDDH